MTILKKIADFRNNLNMIAFKWGTRNKKWLKPLLNWNNWITIGQLIINLVILMSISFILGLFIYDIFWNKWYMLSIIAFLLIDIIIKYATAIYNSKNEFRKLK